MGGVDDGIRQYLLGILKKLEITFVSQVKLQRIPSDLFTTTALIIIKQLSSFCNLKMFPHSKLLAIGIEFRWSFFFLLTEPSYCTKF